MTGPLAKVEPQKKKKSFSWHIAQAPHEVAVVKEVMLARASK